MTKVKSADVAYNAGYRAGLHNTPHKKKEYDMSPEHYEMGYDDGRSDRRDKEHLKINPKDAPFRERIYQNGYQDALKGIEAKHMKDGTYMRGYMDGTDYKEKIKINPKTLQKKLTKKKNSTVRINPTFDDNLNRAYEIGYTDGLNNHSNLPYLKNATLEERNAYTRGYALALKTHTSKFNKEHPKKKNSTVRINPKTPYVSEFTSDEDAYEFGMQKGKEAHKWKGYQPSEIARYIADPTYGPSFQQGYYFAINLHNQKHKYDKKENPKPTSMKLHRYFPKIKPGRPAGGPKGGYWWILDIFNKQDKRMGHLVGKGTKEKATLDAKYKVGDRFKGKTIERVMLSGPYANKPTAKTKRA